ncbi:hypothetical protein [Lysinibacillus sp. 54212]|uniref:hypothetical protein n=1 Tax=Lysinibacillus sp. 54212 TaxID=3119829 RepID=UPI002FCBC6EA
MAVSIGFYRKITDWILSCDNRKIIFRPFQVEGNPYKSRVFLVGAFPHPPLDISLDEASMFAESLVNPELFDHLYGNLTGTKENIGIQQFIRWMKITLNENILCTNINVLQADSLQHLKQLKMANRADYEKGFTIFQHLMEEFQPELIILHGMEAVKQFRIQFYEHLVDYHASIEKIQHLEGLGVFAEMRFDNGKRVRVMACRSLVYYGKSGESFASFKNYVQKVLTSE